MFLKKSKVALRPRIKRVRYTGFSISGGEENGRLNRRLNRRYGVKGENCDLSVGIRAGYGMTAYTIGGKQLTFPGSDAAKRIVEWTYENTDGTEKVGSMYVTNGGTVYIYSEARQLFLKQGRSFSGQVKIVPYYDKDNRAMLVICSEEGVVTYEPTQGFTDVYADVYAEGRALACVFHDRIWFVCGRSRLRFSEPLNEYGWTDDRDGSGYLDLPDEAGEIVGLEAVGERIYVFFKRGLGVLDARGSAQEFRVEKLGYGGGNILEGSVARCGDETFFLAEDGVYVFDGNWAERVATGVPVSWKDDGQVCDETVYDGKIFFTYTDGSGEKKRLVLDAKSRTGYFMTTAFDGLSGTNGKLLAFYDGAIRALCVGGELPSGEDYRVELPFDDFGIAERKVFRSLRFTGEGQMHVTVSNGRTKLSFPVGFADGEARIFPILKGRRFRIELTLGTGCKITLAEAEFGTYGDVGKGGEVW